MAFGQFSQHLQVRGVVLKCGHKGIDSLVRLVKSSELPGILDGLLGPDAQTVCLGLCAEAAEDADDCYEEFWLHVSGSLFRFCTLEYYREGIFYSYRFSVNSSRSPVRRRTYDSYRLIVEIFVNSSKYLYISNLSGLTYGK